MEQFVAVIRQHENIDGAYVEIPLQVQETFGAKRVKVQGWFDGVPYQGSIVTMKGVTLLGIPKDIRKTIGKGFGDEVEVRVEKDESERRVTVPEDLASALRTFPEAESFFRSLSYTHQREYVLWIESARREQTRADRVEKAAALLAQGTPLR